MILVVMNQPMADPFRLFRCFHSGDFLLNINENHLFWVLGLVFCWWSVVFFWWFWWLKKGIPSLKLTVRPWKWMVGIQSFPFGARPIFRCELLVSGSVTLEQKSQFQRSFLGSYYAWVIRSNEFQDQSRLDEERMGIQRKATNSQKDWWKRFSVLHL